MHLTIKIVAVYIIRNTTFTLKNIFVPAVRAVMSRQPLTLKNSQLVIYPYEPLLRRNKLIESLEIHSLPKDLTNELLIKDRGNAWFIGGIQR